MSAALRSFGRLARGLLLSSAVLAITACGKSEPEPTVAKPAPAPDAAPFSVLATTDLRDAQALEAMVE